MVQSRPPEASATGVLMGIGIARNAPRSKSIYPDIVSSINNHGAIARPHLSTTYTF